MKTCIVDERISNKCERRLLIEGFRVIKLPPEKELPAPLASHTDMLMFHHRGRIISSADYCERLPYVFSDIRELCDGAEFTFTDDKYGEVYPRDAIFNALSVGDMIFAKTDTVSRGIIEYAKMRGLRLVHTKQGYPACTALAFGDSAVTADCGMARVLSENGIKVLKIRSGGISLPPYEYGFIGGASGVFENTVYFNGDIMTHPDGGLISDFIKDAGYIPRSLSDEPLLDVGGLLFLS